MCLGLGLLALVSLNGCSKKSGSASDVAEKAYACLQKQDYKAFCDLMDFGQDSTMSASEVEAQQAMMVAMLEEKYSETVAETGAIKSYKVLGEQLSEDGKTANVQMEVQYEKKAEPDTVDVSMVLVDGKWKVSSDK